MTMSGGEPRSGTTPEATSEVRAFTLVETVIAFGLATLVLAPLVWVLVMVFRLDRAATTEMDLTTEALRIMRVTGRDITASRGLVRFTPKGESSTQDGLQMKDGRVIVYELRDGGEIWRNVYGPNPHPLTSGELFGVGFRYFLLVELERGVNVTIELDRTTTIGASASAPPTLELSTVVVPRGW
jgi:hypothetical protein